MKVQTQFREALFDAARDAPRGLQDSAGNPAGSRYDVYRNNVVTSLQDALARNFPILVKLLGEQIFGSLADIYLHQHPPQSPLMMQYGDQMPTLLAGFAPLEHIGYLADVARLEIALRDSYHAADADPIDPSTFAIDDAELALTTLTFAPATALIHSVWPLFDLWRFNTEPDAPAPQAVPQPVLITRAEFDPQPHPLTPAQYEWIVSVRQGDTLGTAHAQALQTDATFDLTPLLTLLLTNNALTKGSQE